MTNPVIQSTAGMKYSPTILVYGPGKVGKTFSIASTTPKPFVLNSDLGVESLCGFDVPFATVHNTTTHCDWFFEQAEKHWRGKYFGLIIDDFTALGEMRLTGIKSGEILGVDGKAIRDGRQQYQALGEWALGFVHRFRRLSEFGYLPIMIAKENKYPEHLTGATIHGPNFPGSMIQNMLDHLFSEIYHLELWQNPQDQKFYRVFRTQKTNHIAAGSRFGKLGEIEYANIGNIFARMQQ